MSEPETVTTDQLLRIQWNLQTRVQSALRNFQKDSSDRYSKTYFKVKLEQLENLRVEFHHNHQLLLTSDLKSSAKYFKESQLDDFEEGFLQAVCAITEKSHTVFPPKVDGPAPNALSNPAEVMNFNSRNASVRLPKLTIPTFSGKYIDWPPFYDAFNRFVHCSPISSIEKFHHLKSALPERFDSDIRDLPLTSENYQIAWELLISRYNNKRVLFTHYMNLLSSQAVIKREVASDIKHLIDTSRACVNSLKQLDIRTDKCGEILVHFLIAKLPSETHSLWERELGNSAVIPSFQKFTEFLEVRYRTLEALEFKAHSITTVSIDSSYQHKSTNNFKPHSNYKHNTQIHHITQDSDSGVICVHCKAQHILRRCPKFLSMDCFERKNVIDRVKCCVNCLSSTHLLNACSSSRNCNTCGKRHHTLLHFPNNYANQSSTTASSNQNPNHINKTTKINHIVATPSIQMPPVLANSTKFISKTDVLLPTAVVKVIASDGSSYLLRTLIDQGSTGALISERATQALNLKRLPIRSSIKFPDGQCTVGKFAVNITIQSRLNDSEIFETFASVVKNVTDQLPTRTIAYHDWKHLRDLELADPEFYRSAPIDLLIGSDMVAHILKDGLRKGQFNEPIAQHTTFGWIVSGTVLQNNQSSNQIATVCSHVSLAQLDSLVKQFYALEAIPDEQQFTSEEKWCKEFIERETKQQANGRYSTRLPFKTRFDPTLTIGRSKQMALNRFHSLERKLNNNAELREQYVKAITEYFECNQIAEVRTNEQQQTKFNEHKQPYVTCCTLPHHAVIKSESITTKCRPVFDASAKTSNGRSLNDILCIGPRLQNDLSAVLLNWRMHKYVITADITKMYRCIDMHEEDSEYQRIIWRNKDGQIQEYKLTTVTFGTACAPYTAIYVTHKIAEAERERYPLAENVLKNEMYVDDVFSGGHNIEQVQGILDHTRYALRSAGMELHKFASNSSELLTTIPKELQSNAIALELQSNEELKTLGMRWQPNFDQFIFKINFDIDYNILSATKRSILSTIAKLFDPLGLINPVVIVAKIFLKRLWAHSLEWDEKLPVDLFNDWKQILITLSELRHIRIPRWLRFLPDKTQRMELHAFSDGSQDAYASTVYLCIENQNHEIHSHLIVAKSKVTPKPPICIPRVELCAAVISIKLVKWVLKHLRLQGIPITVFYWTDATIVLSWIRGDINRWPVFVANRIGLIHTESNYNQWHHVSTHENPADVSSRGLTPTQLASSKLYWHGPKWLREPKENWPSSNWTFLEEEETIPVIVNTATKLDHEEMELFTRFSSFRKLRRIIAWILRFRYNCSVKQEHRRYGPLYVTEMKESLITLVRIVQEECFPAEIKSLMRNEPVNSKSVLISLTPFRDENNIIRVRGRLQNAKLSYNKRHPIILPKTHVFTQLIIHDAHLNTLHGGIQLTSAFLRNQFWIIHSRKIIQSQLRRCVICAKQNPHPVPQLMGNLPEVRVTKSARPFLATGIDYTGALELRASRFRGNTTYKGYIAVFICLTTKAVHLEAITGMTTDHFLSALHRFIGRRGLCHDIYSDNGTNFVGSNNELKAKNVQFQKGIASDIAPLLADKGIQWHFIPPHAPNFGGLWEANVKSVKRHLQRITDGTPLTYEELSTLLVRVESCLNSRPLCPLTADSDDLSVLTPAHFLIGDSMLAPPEPPVFDLSPHRRYLMIQRLVQQFWSRWSNDWLSHLQSRPKWCNQTPNLQINDIVLIKDDRLPPNKWLLGRIVETHPGTDQLVRVVTVRTQNGSFKRSVSKVCKLPVGI